MYVCAYSFQGQKEIGPAQYFQNFKRVHKLGIFVKLSIFSYYPNTIDYDEVNSWYDVLAIVVQINIF